MTTGWTLLSVIVAVVVAIVGRGVVRGMVQGAKEGARRDLITFAGVQQANETLATLSATAAHAFVPPGAERREHPFGWLWWRARVDVDGKVERDMGWALTYRRARKAAGLPVSWKAAGGEFIIAPGRTGVLPADHANAGRADQG